MSMFNSTNRVAKNQELTGALSSYRTALRVRHGNIYGKRIIQAAGRAERAQGNKDWSFHRF